MLCSVATPWGFVLVGGGKGWLSFVSPGAYSRSTGNREKSAEWSDMKLDMCGYTSRVAVFPLLLAQRGRPQHTTQTRSQDSTHFSIKPLSPDYLPIRFDS